MKLIVALSCIVLLLAGCQTVDLYEKQVSIKDHAWKSSEKPTFHFTIKDTTRPYDLYLLFRHADAYHFNNLWIRMTVTGPDGKPMASQFELPLAGKRGTDGEYTWLGSGMDDIYEHRILLKDPDPRNSYLKAGNYTFTIEQIMRENPLKEVYNVGLRLEKK